MLHVLLLLLLRLLLLLPRLEDGGCVVGADVEDGGLGEVEVGEVGGGLGGVGDVDLDGGRRRALQEFLETRHRVDRVVDAHCEAVGRGGAGGVLGVLGVEVKVGGAGRRRVEAARGRGRVRQDAVHREL